MEQVFKIRIAPENDNNGNSDVVNSKNVAFEQSILILQMMKNAGFLPYCEGNYQITFRLCDISVVYAVAVYVISMYNIFKIMSSNLKLFIDDSCDFNCQAFEIVIVILSLQTAFIPISFWKQLSGIRNYFVYWYRFQKIYNNHSRTKLSIADYRSMKTISFVVILISILVSSTICGCLYQNKFTLETFLVYFLISFSMNIGIAFWFSQCILIQVAARVVQHFFQQLIDSLGNTSKDATLICFEIWIALNNVMKSLANNFSFLISLLCFCSFLSALITIYCFVSQIFYSASAAEFDVNFAVLNLVLSIWTISLLYILNDSSYTTTKQIDFRNWIISLNLNAMNGTNKNQVLELLSFFENQKPEIGLFGFEFLSRGFLITISSTLITYIIIILQFRNTGVRSSTKPSNSNCSNITT